MEEAERREIILPQSFIIRFWVEESLQEDVPSRWRGQITHVPSGDRRYLQDFDEIMKFISQYLGPLGVEVGTKTQERP